MLCCVLSRKSMRPSGLAFGAIMLLAGGLALGADLSWSCSDGSSCGRPCRRAYANFGKPMNKKQKKKPRPRRASPEVTSGHARAGRGVEGAKLRFVDKVLALKRNRTPQRVSWGASCGHHPGSAPVRQIALGWGPPRGRLLRHAEAARSQMSRPSTWRAV